MGWDLGGGLPNASVVVGAATTVVVGVTVSPNAANDFQILGDGSLLWSPAAGGTDTRLRRNGPGVLRLDNGAGGNGQFYIDGTNGDLLANNGVATQVRVGTGPGGASGITFQSGEAGSNLYRSAAGVLTMDGGLVLGGTGAQALKLNNGTYAGGTNVGGTISFGTGAPVNASGVNGDIYLRVDGGAATTIYQRRAGAWVGIV